MNYTVCPKYDSLKSDNYTESNKEKKQRTDVKQNRFREITLQETIIRKSPILQSQYDKN